MGRLITIVLLGLYGCELRTELRVVSAPSGSSRAACLTDCCAHFDRLGRTAQFAPIYAACVQSCTSTSAAVIAR